ncbi:hypothetical protein GCM10009789_77280 [Kribbella sancticallisti]|uniref:HTH tetR-type domain-containing protein n=1 Tax=Kribbella sancticallisti TaxID=460087 RepID=A0ABP4QN97_9ACTN
MVRTRALPRNPRCGRQAQARRSREEVLDATTIAAIAAAAGVSVESIYKASGGKAGLVRAIYERGLTGLGSVPAYQRSDEMRAHETDPATVMRK